MSRSNSLTPLSDDDYVAIEAAVMETSRGRWFLGEYARRNRTADTGMLLEAIGRLERFVTGERTAQDIERIRYELVEMAEAITRTKAEIAALRPSEGVQNHFEEATEVLDAVVRTTERATSDILEAAENIQEAAWTLRELDSADAPLCDELDRRATDIYTACSFQDITAQRTTKVVQVLRYLEARINAMIDVWSQPSAPPADRKAAAAVSAPSFDKRGLTQDDVDIVIREAHADAEHDPGHSGPGKIHLVDNDLVFIENEAEDAPTLESCVSGQPVLEAPEVDRRGEAFAAIDTLDVAEKIRRFS